MKKLLCAFIFSFVLLGGLHAQKQSQEQFTEFVQNFLKLSQEEQELVLKNIPKVELDKLRESLKYESFFRKTSKMLIKQQIGSSYVLPGLFSVACFFLPSISKQCTTSIATGISSGLSYTFFGLVAISLVDKLF